MNVKLAPKPPPESRSRCGLLHGPVGKPGPYVIPFQLNKMRSRCAAAAMQPVPKVSISVVQVSAASQWLLEQAAVFLLTGRTDWIWVLVTDSSAHCLRHRLCDL